MHFDIGVVAVGFARQQRLDLAAVGLGLEAFQLLDALLLARGIALGLAKFDEGHRIFEVALETRERAQAGLRAQHARASFFARKQHRSRNWGLRLWRSVRRGGAWLHRRQRCLLSSPMDCLIDSTSASASARIVIFPLLSGFEGPVASHGT